MTLWRMRIACWTHKATNTHSEHVIIIAFPLQQWLHERVSLLRYTLPVLLSTEIWPLTTEGQVRFPFNPCGICGGQIDIVADFSPSVSVFFCHYHSSSAPYSSICCSLQKDKRAKPGNLVTSKALYKPLAPIS